MKENQRSFGAMQWVLTYVGGVQDTPNKENITKFLNFYHLKVVLTKIQESCILILSIGAI